MSFFKNTITAKMALFLLGLIEKLFINKQEPEIRDGLLIIFQPTKKSIGALLDEDPNDKEQLKKVWKDFLNNPQPWDYSEKQLRQLILARLEGTVYQGVILPILPVVIDSLQSLVDENPANADQIKAIFDEWLHDEQTFEQFLQNLLRAILKDRVSDDMIDEVIALIMSFIKTE